MKNVGAACNQALREIRRHVAKNSGRLKRQAWKSINAARIARRRRVARKATRSNDKERQTGKTCAMSAFYRAIVNGGNDK